MPYSSAVEITVNQIVRAGITVTSLPDSADGTNGNKFRWYKNAYLEVENGGGASITVTINTPGTVDGQAIDDLAVSVPAGARKKIGPFTGTFLQSDGYVWATFSAVSSVNIGAYRT
jgi:hypothetical protein